MVDAAIADSPCVKTHPAIMTSLVTDESGFDALEAEWDELLEQSDQRVFFLRWSWNRLWWRVLKPRDSELFIITARDEQDRLVGLAPFYLRQRRTAGIPHIRELLFLGTGIYAQTSERLDLIARRGCERTVAEAVAQCLERSNDWDRLCLNEVPASSAILPHLLDELGEDAIVQTCDRSYYIDTTVDWETFLRSVRHSARQSSVRRTRKLFSSHQCELKRVETADELEPAIEALVRLHQMRWQSKGEPGSFALQGVEEFLNEAMRMSFREQRLGLTTLDVNGRTAAARLDFIDNGVAHAFQAGFDPAYAGQSLGSVMNGLCIRACIEDDAVREYDLMGGNAAYKEFWTRTYRESVCLTLVRSGSRAAAYKSIELAKVMGKSLVRAAVPESIRLAGHRLINQKHYK